MPVMAVLLSRMQYFVKIIRVGFLKRQLECRMLESIDMAQECATSEQNAAGWKSQQTLSMHACCDVQAKCGHSCWKPEYLQTASHSNLDHKSSPKAPERHMHTFQGPTYECFKQERVTRGEARLPLQRSSRKVDQVPLSRVQVRRSSNSVPRSASFLLPLTPPSSLPCLAVCL
jgi:hypothetical protein